MRVLSLGAGVQSSTLLLMAVHGELELDGAIFADTGWEPAAVYAWLAVLEAAAVQAGIRFQRVSKGNIRALTLSATGKHYAAIPFYMREADGTLRMGRRQCTKEYKLRPIQRELRAWGATRANPVDMLVGISLDEFERMSDSRVQYVRNVFPLVERRMTRGDCLVWLARHGYPEPTKSACIGCPYRRDSEWQRLNAAELADAVDFDAQIRHHTETPGAELFVYRQFVPLADVDFRTPQARGQLDLFDAAEVDGCGVLCPAE